jgi:hypothetical protein
MSEPIPNIDTPRMVAWVVQHRWRAIWLGRGGEARDFPFLLSEEAHTAAVLSNAQVPDDWRVVKVEIREAKG